MGADSDLLYVFRETKFKSLSTLSRDMGKVSVTVEINSMSPFRVHEKEHEKNIIFVKETLKDCINFFRGYNTNKIYKDENVLKTITLKKDLPLVFQENKSFLAKLEDISVSEGLGEELNSLEYVLITPVAMNNIYSPSVFEGLVQIPKEK